MIRNYFKTAWRSLIRNKTYAIINIAGLSLGIACSIIIFSIVAHHLSFENFNHNKDRIYRVGTEVRGEHTFYSHGSPAPLAKAMRNDYAFAEKTTRVEVFWGTQVSVESPNNNIKKFKEDNGIAITTSDYFDIFNFPLVSGDITTALNEPNTALITQKLARKYFGSEEVIGKTINIGNKVNAKITGVLRDIPLNTERVQEIYVSDKNLKDFSDWQAKEDSWGGFTSECNTFLLLKPSVAASSVEKIFPQIMEKYYAGNINKNVFRFHLQPLEDIHFDADYGGYVDKKYLWAAAFIGLFLIITACVNFINLATAQASNRSREIGVRKVLGGMRAQLFWQFIAETTIITMFATLLAVGLAQLSLPFVNTLFKVQLTVNPFMNTWLLLFLSVIVLTVVFLSGSYPGLILSGFKPAIALKGKLPREKTTGFPMRKILVIAQFSISQMLIIGTIVIASQMNFSKHSDLGFDKDNIVMLPVPIHDSIGKIKMKWLISRLKEVPAVKDASLCMEPPSANHSNVKAIRYDNDVKERPWSFNAKPIDENYLSLFNLKLIAGRGIYPSDTINQYIVNEVFIRKLGLRSPEEIINKNISVDGVTAPVVGVVKNFYDKSFHLDINPVVMFPALNGVEHCAVKINVPGSRSGLASIEKIWNDVYPQYIYEHEFLDTELEKYYEFDDTILALIETFAGIAILIGCLGLYGLVSFMVAQKTKEIGIRKVLGAGVQSILWMFGKEFSRLVLIAFIMSAPIAWWFMNRYLEDFKFRIQIGVGVFILAIAITLLIAGVTIGFRSLKAAMANPIKSLRTE